MKPLQGLTPVGQEKTFIDNWNRMCVRMEKRITSHQRKRKGRRIDYGSGRNQGLFDTDLTLLQDGEGVSFAKRLQIQGL
jgi:hypothetical protein